MTRKKLETTNSNRSNFGLTFTSANKADYPVLYAEDVWDFISSSDTNLYALAGSNAGQYTQHDINESLAAAIAVAAESGGDVDIATTSTAGTIKVSNKLQSSVTLTSSNGDTANRYYGVQIDSSGLAFVNVPWSGSTYSNATTSAAGLMSADDKTKLNGIATNANNYSHPSNTSYSSGLYKITVDGLGHVTSATAVIKSDITSLGIPGENTTYSNATTSVAGLMSSTDKTTLDNLVTNVGNIKVALCNVTYGTTFTTELQVDAYLSNLNNS